MSVLLKKSSFFSIALYNISLVLLKFQNSSLFNLPRTLEIYLCSPRSPLGETILTKTKVPSHWVTPLKWLHSLWSSQWLPKIEFAQKYCKNWGYLTRASNVQATLGNQTQKSFSLYVLMCGIPFLALKKCDLWDFGNAQLPFFDEPNFKCVYFRSINEEEDPEKQAESLTSRSYLFSFFDIRLAKKICYFTRKGR